MFATVAKLIETRFKTGWEAVYSTIPIRFKNVPWKQPTGGEWVSLSIIPGDGRQASLGSGKLERQLGIVVVQIFTPKNTGSRRSYDLADAAATILRYQTLSEAGVNVILRAPELANVGERMDNLQDNLKIPFQAEKIFN